MKISSSTKIQKNDSIETALLKKAGNTSLSSKTLKKLVRITNSTMGISKENAKRIFISNEILKANESNRKLGEIIYSVSQQVKNRQVRNQYERWCGNCLGIYTLNPMDESISDNKVLTGKKYNQEDRELAEFSLRYAGIISETLPETYQELVSLIKTSKGAETACSVSRYIKGMGFDLYDKVNLTVLNELSNELIFGDKKILAKAISEVNDGRLEVEFEQKSILGNNTFRKNGLCLQLSLKWLTEKENDITPDFFDDVNTSDGKEEIMWLAMHAESASPVKIPDRYIDYVRSKGVFGGYIGKVKKGLEDGRYIFFIESSDKSSGHVVSAFIDNKNSHFSFFDPETGQYGFESCHDFDNFLRGYLSSAYSDFNLKTSLWRFDLLLLNEKNKRV